MPKNVKPLIGTTNVFSVASGDSDVTGATIRSDYPPNDENVASAFIHNTDPGSGASATITVKFQLYSGAEWGTKHTCVDASGSNITFLSRDDDAIAEVNLYAQPEWKLADAWRIVLSRAAPTLMSGNATAVIR
jgi:hypothetical protein